MRFYTSLTFWKSRKTAKTTRPQPRLAEARPGAPSALQGQLRNRKVPAAQPSLPETSGAAAVTAAAGLENVPAKEAGAAGNGAVSGLVNGLK